MHPASAIPAAEVRATAVEHGAGAELAPHSHYLGQVSIVLRGTMAITSEEGWWVMPPGLAMWIPPGVLHGARYSESSSVMHVRLDPVLTAPLPRTCLSVVATALLRALAFEVARLQRESPAGDAMQQTMQEAMQLATRLMVLQLGLPQTSPGLYLPHGRDRRLQQATALLRAAPGEALGLDALAQRVHTSGRTLARLFVGETGMSFTRWRDHLRIISAIDQLARGQTITQAAFELGYSSASSFTTLFTRLLGMPPRRYMQYLEEQNS